MVRPALTGLDIPRPGDLVDTTRTAEHDVLMGDVVALPLEGSVALPDVRGEHRALQVTWHDNDQVFVVSTWRYGRCVGSVRLAPAEAAALVGTLAEGLERATTPAPTTAPGTSSGVMATGAPSAG